MVAGTIRKKSTTNNKMAAKVRKGLGEILVLHQNIVRSLKAQKVRQDQMLEKYADDVEKELEIPSNRFMRWSTIIKPYLDSVVSSKLMDFELISAFEKFVKDLVQYENSFIITEDEIADLEYGFDMSVETSLRLEKKIVGLKRQLAAVREEEETNGRINHSKRGAVAENTEYDESEKEEKGEIDEISEIDEIHEITQSQKSQNEEICEITKPENSAEPLETKRDIELKAQFQKLMEGFDKKYKERMKKDSEEETEQND